MALLARQKRAALVLVTTLFFGNARTLLTMPTPPVDDTVTIDDLTRDPYTVYKRFRAESPVIRVSSARRTLLVKAADTKYVKDNPVLFSSDDPSTPMKRAFQFHTLMRKDGAQHQRERNAMAAAFSPSNIKNVWLPLYAKGGGGVYRAVAARRSGGPAWPVVGTGVGALPGAPDRADPCQR
jgi:hypothetical protein